MFEIMKPSKRLPMKVWLTAQRSMGLLVGGNHTSSRWNWCYTYWSYWFRPY
ncbi:hypothetical protein E1A91_A01G232600v1 [Gossypium mustelinum]|uniref:Uncharacterized protein n=1 Tax=Gossypium mustelinum TaxID=34275 RepID=A0A5D3AIF9_GOSMU|nr:hypothetical protein E1A91_A01G232600v1 [Gossypium mustelinum]